MFFKHFFNISSHLNSNVFFPNENIFLTAVINAYEDELWKMKHETHKELNLYNKEKGCLSNR